MGSTFIILVPNCPLLLSWCQIVPFIILVPNCPVPNCPVPNCPVPNCPTIIYWTGWCTFPTRVGWLQQTTDCFTRGCCSPRHLYWGVVFASRPWSYIIPRNIITELCNYTTVQHFTTI